MSSRREARSRRPTLIGPAIAGSMIIALVVSCGDLPSGSDERVPLTLRVIVADTLVIGDTVEARIEARDPSGWLVESNELPVEWRLPEGVWDVIDQGHPLRVVPLYPGTQVLEAYIPDSHDLFEARPGAESVLLRYGPMDVGFAGSDGDTTLTSLTWHALPLYATDHRGNTVLHGGFQLEVSGEGALDRQRSHPHALLAVRPGTDTLFLGHDLCHEPCHDTLVVTVAPVVSEVQVGSPTLTSLGDTLQLVATVWDAAGSQLAATPAWTLANPGDSVYVQLLEDGRVIARQNGSAVVVAAVGEVVDSPVVTVRQLTADFTLLLPSMELVGLGSSDTARVVRYDARGNVISTPSETSITFSTDNGAILRATMSAADEAVVTAVGYGIGTIEGTAYLLCRDCVRTQVRTASIRVVPQADSMRIAAVDDTLAALGATTLLRSEVIADGAAVPAVPVEWTSLDTTVAVVDELGNVTAVAPGAAAIQGRVVDVADTAIVVVRQVVATVVVDPAPALVLGASVPLTSRVLDANGYDVSDRAVSWSSSEPSQVSIDAAGVATALAEGSPDITATVDGVPAHLTMVALPSDYMLLEARRAICVLTPAGRAYCGGERLQPRGLESVLALSESGAYHPDRGWEGFRCTLDFDGYAYCWGKNYHGELGVGDLESRANPTPVASSVRFSDISAGRQVGGSAMHTCGVATDGRAYCWGVNWSDMLGFSGTALSPKPVDTEIRFSDVETNYLSTCGVQAVTGGVYCWGSGWTRPTALEGSIGIIRITAGHEFACGVDGQGTGYCWGRGEGGQLGNGEAGDRNEAIPIAGGHAFQRIVGGLYHACALASDGMAYCWGNNQWGQLGDGTTRERSYSPVQAAGGQPFIDVTAGYDFGAGKTEAGALWVWGGPAGEPEPGFRYRLLVQGAP